MLSPRRNFDMIWLLNILIPGSGLIILRREWLGLFLSLLYGVCGNVAITGTLIAPESLPRWAVVLAVAMASAMWAMGQLLLASRQKDIARRQSGLSRVLTDAESALATGDVESAREHLEGGIDLDEESVEWHVLWARVCTLKGDSSGGRQAWTRVIRLDSQRRYQTEARQALEQNV
jgi:hypothetical protein